MDTTLFVMLMCIMYLGMLGLIVYVYYEVRKLMAEIEKIKGKQDER